MIMNRMADEGYRTSTIYQARIILFNMLDYAYQNHVIMKNPCNGMVKSDIGKPTQKKEALTLEQQKRFVRGIEGNTYECQDKFLLQTGLRACLKIHSHNLHFPLCAIFDSNLVNVARYTS